MPYSRPMSARGTAKRSACLIGSSLEDNLGGRKRQSPDELVHAPELLGFKALLCEDLFAEPHARSSAAHGAQSIHPRRAGWRPQRRGLDRPLTAGWSSGLPWPIEQRRASARRRLGHVGLGVGAAGFDIPHGAGGYRRGRLGQGGRAGASRFALGLCGLVNHNPTQFHAALHRARRRHDVPARSL